MPLQPLADTHFFLHGESEIVTRALSRYIGTQGATVSEITRLEELRAPEDSENVLVVHYDAGRNLGTKLLRLKKDSGSLRVLLLHEFTDRGRFEEGVLAVTDHILEKPFTQSSLEKALGQFHFHPLTGKAVFVIPNSSDALAESLMRTLGATVFSQLPETETPALELAVFCPIALDDAFRALLRAFRARYEDVPVFMLYDPRLPGILDSGILNEIAYLVQKPVSRRVLREKILAFFEQPQRDRRKNPRKKGISQIWISAFNSDFGAPELFESPFLVDISLSGLSFQSYMDHKEGQTMAIWVIAEDHPDKIIDLRGQIRWRRQEADTPGVAVFKYGVEFTRQDSEAFTTFARMIAMHAG